MFIFHIGVFGLGLRMDVSQLKHFTKRNDCLVTLPICSDWKSWWKEKPPLRLLMLGRRMVWNMLSMDDVLRRKNMMVDGLCVLCSNGLETIPTGF